MDAEGIANLQRRNYCKDHVEGIRNVIAVGMYDCNMLRLFGGAGGQNTSQRLERNYSMKALLFDHIPDDRAYIKDQNKSFSIYGAAVHALESAKAILEYGTYDRYYFVRRAPVSIRARDQEALPTWAADRGEIVRPDAMRAIKSIDHLVMLTNQPMPHTLIPYRTIAGRRAWPAVGFIHALTGVISRYEALGVLMSDLDAGDALICSSLAGRLVVQKLFSHFVESYPNLVRTPSLQLPVIPLGVNCKAHANRNKTASRLQLGLPSESVILLYFGRFSPVSKCDLGPLMISFARSFKGEGENVLLILAGDDTQHGMADALRRYSVELGCERSIRILPDCTQGERNALFAAADIFLSPSDNIQETFGLTLVEAMAAGLPVLASDWSGYREIVKHGTTGFLVPTYWPAFGAELDLVNIMSSFDIVASATAVDCEQLMSYANILVSNRELRQTMGEHARADAQKRFDYKVIVNQWEELWDELRIKAAGRRRQIRGAPSEPYRFGIQNVFEGFPTHAIDDLQEVRLTETGKWWLRSKVPLAADGLSNALFEPGLLRDIVTKAGKKGQTVGMLVQDLMQAGETDLIARVYIGRLAKYGIIALSSFDRDSFR